MTRLLRIEVNPDILTWARESLGFSISKAAQKIKIKNEKIIEQWELGNVLPTITQLRKMAKIYKRPLAVFFLPKPPNEPSLPTDFRTIEGKTDSKYSEKILLTIRNARRIQSLSKELIKEVGIENKINYIEAQVSDDPEDLAERVRKIFNLSFEKKKSNNIYSLFLKWQSILENNGILVIQSSMPIEEIRGFSLNDPLFPIIAVNSKDSFYGRIFTLFHEFAHLILKSSGICDIKSIYNGFQDHRKIEVFCNHFAGALLVPKNILLNHKVVDIHLKNDSWLNKDLEILSRYFSVSKEVILRRLLIFGYTTDREYKSKITEWRREYQSKEKKAGFGKTDPVKKCIKRKSKTFVSLVLNSYHNDRITYKDVGEYLNLKIKHIPKIEKVIKGKN